MSAYGARDASSTTNRLNNRTLFANRTILQTALNTNLTNHITLQGGGQSGATDYFFYESARTGAIETTVAEEQSYILSVLDNNPSAPIVPIPAVPISPVLTGITPGDGTITIQFTQETPLPPITNYQYNLNGGAFILFSPAATSSPVTISGLTNGTSYTIILQAINDLGTSTDSNSLAAVPGLVPGPPTALVATPGVAQASVTFTPPVYTSGLPITGYTITSSPGGFQQTGFAPPIVVTGLTNGTAYTFTAIATNIIGNSVPSAASSPVTPVAIPLPVAPVITSVDRTDTFFIVNFTQDMSNGASAVTNYDYSTNGGVSFITLSPADGITPITIRTQSDGSAFLPNTTYQFQMRAVNAAGLGSPCANYAVKTMTYAKYSKYTTVGSASWTAGSDSTIVQYIVVGGGGGSGGAYSEVLNLGNVPLGRVSTGGVPDSYWINLDEGFSFGRMYYDIDTVVTLFLPARMTIQTGGGTITLNASFGDQNKWYPTEIVYWVGSGIPTVTNYAQPSYTINSTNNNNVGPGSGGGAGSQFSSALTYSVYVVTPGTAYSVTVGAGGAGGTAATNTETAGSRGGSSSFATITAAGGSGGSGSHTASVSTNGYNNGGKGGQDGILSGTNLLGGGGGQGISDNGSDGTSTAGGAGGAGVTINFDGAGNVTYVSGGIGGVPNTVVTGTAAANTGRGGIGTGSLINSYASGNNGGDGLVWIKYWTDTP